MKHNYYVALVFPHSNHIKYVTAVDHKANRAAWKAGEPALKMAKSVAEDIAFGLNTNGFHAVTLRAPDHLNGYLSNEKDNA